MSHSNNYEPENIKFSGADDLETNTKTFDADELESRLLGLPTLKIRYRKDGEMKTINGNAVTWTPNELRVVRIGGEHVDISNAEIRAVHPVSDNG